MRFAIRLKSLLILGNDISELYEDNIYLTMVCTFWSKFGSKVYHLTLYPTEKGKVFSNIVPPSHTSNQVHRDLKIKYVIDTMHGISYERGERCQIR